MSRIRFIPNTPLREPIEDTDPDDVFDGYYCGLHCTHHLNAKSYYTYFLPCRFLRMTNNGMAKVQVCSRQGKEYIRYVSPSRVWKKEQLDRKSQ